MGKRFMVVLGCAIAMKLAGCGGVTDARSSGSTADGGGMNGTGGGVAGDPANNGGAAGGIAGARASGGTGPGSGGAIGTGASVGTAGKSATGGRVGTGGTKGTGATVDASADSAPDVGAPDVGVPGDGGCEDYAVVDAVSWGPDGGRVQYVDRSYLSTPRQYKHEHDYFTNAMQPACMTEVIGCPSPLLAEINAALRGSTVQNALDAHTVFGTDSRPVDGQVFRIRLGSGYFDVGTPCSSSSTACTQVPPSVQALVDVLEALDAQELAKKACTDVFGKP